MAVRGNMFRVALWATLAAAPAATLAFGDSDDAAEEAAETADAAEDWADDAADAADDSADDAADAADDSADDAADAADDSADDAEDTADDAGDDADDSADAVEDSAEDDSGPAEESSEQSGRRDRDEHRVENSGEGQAIADSDEITVELDEEGYETAAGELLAVPADAGSSGRLDGFGLTIVTREMLTGLGMELVSLKVPDGSTGEAMARLTEGELATMVARNHLFLAGSSGKRVATVRRIHRSRLQPKGVVGVIDGGIDSELLGSRVQLHTAEFARRSAARAHGSTVAAVLADSGVGEIYSANIFAGRRATTSALVRALDWMARNKVPVINISLAGPPNRIVHQAIRILVSRGHAVVAAIGNAGPAAPPLYPAAYPEVIAVTAVDRSGSVYRRANRGPHTQFAAPGVKVIVAYSHGKARQVSGTSFAAPVVSARLARSLDRADPELRRRTVDRIVKSARDLGKPGRDPVYGFGLIEPGS